MAKANPTREFEQAGAPLEERLVVGLSKVGLALKSNAWTRGLAEGVSPTQAQILSLLRNRGGGLRLSAIAEALGITMPTASEAAGSLTDKKLLQRGRDPEDGRAARLSLTRRGSDLADRVSEWPDFMLQALAALDETERNVMLRALIKTIGNLQAAGRIPVQRMCVTCRYFRPNAHREDAQRPHHCAYADVAFGETSLRLDCAEHDSAPDEEEGRLWQSWLTGTNHQQTQ